MYCRDVVRPGYVVNPSRFAVACYEAYMSGWVMLEMMAKTIRVASLSRCEDGDLLHDAKQGRKQRIPKCVWLIFSYSIEWLTC
jgi:hypothetical protein